MRPERNWKRDNRSNDWLSKWATSASPDQKTVYFGVDWFHLWRMARMVGSNWSECMVGNF